MTEHILSLSYGKDSLACLGAIEQLGLTIDRIVHAEIWATETIPADLPPMVEFKKKADKIIKERYGITVEHVCAQNIDGEKGEKVTYCDGFYHQLTSGKYAGNIKGFPLQIGPWCQKLKTSAINRIVNSNCVGYIGIAAGGASPLPVSPPKLYVKNSYIVMAPLKGAGEISQSLTK